MTLLFEPLTDETKVFLAVQFLNLKQKGDDKKLLTEESLDIEVSDSHPVYALEITDIAEGKGLDKAKLIGSRCFIEMKSEVSAAEIGQESNLASINEGPFTFEFIRAIEFVSRSDRVAREDYQVRFLLVPALYTAALWLHSAINSKHDLLITLPLSDEREKIVITADSFYEKLKSNAKQTLKAQQELDFDD